MPIYEYVCSDCNLRFELLRPLSKASEDVSCPRCHNSAKRVLSTFTSFSIVNNESIPLAGSNPCASCSAASCDSCGL